MNVLYELLSKFKESKYEKRKSYEIRNDLLYKVILQFLKSRFRRVLGSSREGSIEEFPDSYTKLYKIILFFNTWDFCVKQ